MLFNDNDELIEDWFDACPNSDIDLPDVESLGVFDLGRMFFTERDRSIVAQAIGTAQCNQHYFMHMMIKSDTLLHQGFLFAARELYHKIPHGLISSILAFSHSGGKYTRLNFPDKHHKIPKRLLSAFGLRSNEIGWFLKLADNESFVRMVGNGILPGDWKHIPLYDTTLLKSPPKEATAPMSKKNEGATLW